MLNLMFDALVCSQLYLHFTFTQFNCVTSHCSILRVAHFSPHCQIFGEPGSMPVLRALELIKSGYFPKPYKLAGLFLTGLESRSTVERAATVQLWEELTQSGVPEAVASCCRGPVLAAAVKFGYAMDVDTGLRFCVGALRMAATSLLPVERSTDVDAALNSDGNSGTRVGAGALFYFLILFFLMFNFFDYMHFIILNSN